MFKNSSFWFFIACVSLTAASLGVAWMLEPKQHNYFVSYYITSSTNGVFGDRVFKTDAKLNVELINKMKSTLLSETTNSAVVLLSIQEMP